jgi:hypothetical protein
VSGALGRLPRGAGRDRRAAQSTSGNAGIAMASGNDMKAHSSTYESFIGMLKWSVPLLAIITFVVVLIIS